MNTALQRLKRIEQAVAARLPPENVAWAPREGPQTEGYYSKADVLYFGGSAGTGKTQLLLGLAGTASRQAIIFRKTFKQFLDIERKAIALYGMKNYQRQRGIFELRGRTIELGAVANFGDEHNYDGRPHDHKLFDEITHFPEAQFRHLCGWRRTEIMGQRCRVVVTGNPPTDAEGRWVVRYWGPWLDPMHPRPAKPGELRWYTTIDGKDEECDGPEPVMVGNEMVQPLSRTFIPGTMVKEYRETGYAAALQALPEPLRSQLLHGDFSAGMGDDALQVIPSAWVDAAMERWKFTAKPDMRMSAVGCDPARGNPEAPGRTDDTVIARRYGAWYDEVIAMPGKGTPDGGIVSALCLHYRQDHCPIHVDVIGIGSSVVDSLRDADAPYIALNGSQSSQATDRSGKLRFANKRAQWHWEMREALDPDHGCSICLPFDPELRGDLCAPRWKMRGGRLAVEEKAEIKLRIGRSPDKGDAVIYAMAESAMMGIPASAFATGVISFAGPFIGGTGSPVDQKVST